MAEPREILRLLRALQELDFDLFKVKEELRRLPEERARRRSRIDSELQRLEEIEREAHSAQMRVKEIEDMTTGQRQRLRKLENEISKTADQALIVAFQHEIRDLKRDISEAEEEGLGYVETVDQLTGQAQELRSGIDELETEFAEYGANVESEIAQAEERRRVLEDERQKRMGGTVDAATLEKYEKLVDAREGQALALLDGRVCQGCNVSVPSNIYVRLARGLELVECPSCNRILYLPDGE